MSEKCSECNKVAFVSFISPDTQKTICIDCALKVPMEKWKTDEARKCLDAERKKRAKAEPIAPEENKDVGINRSVYAPLDDKPKKKKGISEEIKDFLWLQERVISKLNRHPELYQILDDLRYDEIKELLIGKTIGKVSEVVPTHLGGDMNVEPSKKTKKLFENLEKQFAEEDEKTGKKPYNFDDNNPVITEGRGFSLWTDEAWKPQKQTSSHYETVQKLDANPDNLKICKTYRKKLGHTDMVDYHYVDCSIAICRKGCPIWTKKEETTNAEK